MRVLRVADVPRTQAAGVSGVILRSGAALTELGHEVDYLFSDDLLARRLPPWLRFLLMPAITCVQVGRRVRLTPVDVVEIHRPLASLYAPLSRTRVLSRRLPPCVLQCQGLEELWWKTMRACWARAGLSTTLRSRAVYRILIAQGFVASRYAAGIVVPTQIDVGHLVNVLGIAPRRVSVAHNGVELELLDIQREPPPPSLRLLFFGTWLDRKGAPDMAAAWSIVQERWPSTSLTIAGSGHDAEEVRASFEPSCRGSVEVLPHIPRSEVPRLLARHDVMVLPSWYEGMPLAVLEGAAAGMAVVTTKIAGTLEIFRATDPEQDGALLVEVQDPVDLADAIGRLAEEPALVRSLQSRARKRASEFTWDSSARSFALAYEQAIAGKAASVTR